MKEPTIIYEDKDLLVLDKPAGLVVNRSETAKDKTLQDWIEGKFKLSIFHLPDYRSGIVHRLDKETSGIILVAKTRKAFENLQLQFKERKIKKKYLVLVHGYVSLPVGCIKAPISRSPFDRKKFGIFLGGKEAETHYRVLEYYSHPQLGKFTLLEVEPKTGRTHQIRVHFKFIGHPVVGDNFYAGRKVARNDRKWCPRQFLHASFLQFFHPYTGKKISFSLPLPPTLENALKYLKG